MASLEEARAFVPIKYRIHWMQEGTAGSREVEGFAFETPGWPEYHACVRWGNRFSAENVFDTWIIDHFETGMAVSEAGAFMKKEEAPEALRRLLETKGREAVHKVLSNYGVIPL